MNTIVLNTDFTEELTDSFQKFTLIEWLKSPAFILSAASIVLGFVVWVILKRAITKYNEKRKQKRYKYMLSIIKAIIIMIVIIAVLEANGFNVTTVVAGLGIISVVVAFALQDTLKDVIMGLHILSDEYFSPGDVVAYDGMEGIVESFTIRTTKIRDIDTEELYVISNRDIEKIKQSSHLCDVDVPLPYSEDADKMHALMKEITKRVAEMDGIEKAEYKGTQEFNASSVSYKLRFFCDPVKKPQLRRNVLQIIQSELKAEDVHIPFNQLDIHNID